MHIFSTIFFCIIGAIVGSFLNVVIYRFRSQEGGIIAGQSHCRSCDYKLSWYDNIPLASFLMLGGKCRKCAKKISWQYPLVELFTSLLFGLVAFFLVDHLFDGRGIVLGLMVMATFAALTVILVYDFKYMEVPMIAIWIGISTAVAFIILSDVFSGFALRDPWSLHIVSHGLAGAVAFGFFFSLSYVSDEKWMGYGDGYIALVIGLLLGPATTFLAILIAVWSGAIVGMIFAALKNKTLKTAIPFGPFLVLGAIGAFTISHLFPDWSGLLW